MLAMVCCARSVEDRGSGCGCWRCFEHLGQGERCDLRFANRVIVRTLTLNAFDSLTSISEDMSRVGANYRHGEP